MRTCPRCQEHYAEEMDFCPHDATPLPAPFASMEFEIEAGLSGQYHIVRRLGVGGMGTVFLGEQISLGNRPVAIKILRRRLLDDPEFLQRFRDEATSTARIRHQNVVTIYESGQANDGLPYIAMEYLHGETLRQTLERSSILPLSACAEILQQAARGLNAAHKIGIIHRDIKPDNVFLTHDDNGQPLVKIVDFGIAKMRESSTRTMTGLAVGTPAYMSVEQASGMRSDELDGRSDVYSLGIVAYEMVTGCVPFQADTPLAYVRKHLVEPPPRLRTVRPDLKFSGALESVIMRALAKERKKRYSSVIEFTCEFERSINPPKHQICPGEGSKAQFELTLPKAEYSTDKADQKSRLAGREQPENRDTTRPISGGVLSPLNNFGLGLPVAIPSVLLIIGLTWQVVSWPRTQPAYRLSSTASKPAPLTTIQPRKSTLANSVQSFNDHTQYPAAVTAPTPTEPSEQTIDAVRAAIAMGDFHLNLGEYDDAIAEYKKGLAADPENTTLQTKIEHARMARRAEQRLGRWQSTVTKIDAFAK